MEAQKILDIQNNPEEKKISGGGILTISFRLCCRTMVTKPGC